MATPLRLVADGGNPSAAVAITPGNVQIDLEAPHAVPKAVVVVKL